MSDFIFTDYLQDITICDRIIDWFKETEMKGPGWAGGPDRSDNTVKVSTDSNLRYNVELCNEYLAALDVVCKKYIEKYSFADYYAPWDVMDSVNIQYYQPGEGFYAWHCERGAVKHPAGSRHMVFMTYLNDVTDGGETEFYYQELKIQPKKGLTVLWPADWTHTHRGITSPTQEKYIVTGWYNYLK